MNFTLLNVRNTSKSNVSIGIIIICIIISNISNLAFSQEIKWWFDTKDGCFGQTASADLDSDDFFEFVFGCYRNDGKVYALKSKDGSILWEYFTGVNNFEGCNDTAPLIYDVDGDGKPEVIVASSCTPLTYCFSGADGSIKWKAPTRGSDSPPVIGDIDGDGINEILHGQFRGYVICLDAKTGAQKWEILVLENTWIQTAPTLVDIDGDGILDFVVATWCLNKEDTNRLYAYRGYDRKLLWTYDLNDVVYHGTAVADLNKDNKLELIIGDYSGTVHCLKAEDGSIVWTHFDPNYRYIGSPVSVGDIDGNGYCDLIFSSAYEIIALNYDGSIKWKYRMPNYGNAFRGVVLADINNNHLPDVIFGTSKGNVIGLNGIDGAEIFNLDLAEHIGKEFNIDHSPVISDFDKDGILDLFIVGGYTKYPDFSNNYGRAYCISLFKGNGPDWLMFQNNVHRNSSVCNQLVNVLENKSNLSGTLKIYPNPFVDFYKIHFESVFESNLLVYLTDIYGKIVFSQNYLVSSNQGELEIICNNISSGIYIIHIIAGNRREILPIIKLE